MIGLYSPSWFACVLQAKWIAPVVRVKGMPSKVRHIVINGDFVYTVSRYPIQEMHTLYLRRFFHQDPMACLKVIFASTYYGRVKYR